MAPGRARVCVVGSANVDLTFRTNRLPEPGETLLSHGFQMGYGGKGANQAVMAVRLGATVTMIGKVGVDEFGKQVLGNLRQQGIDTTHVFTDTARSTGLAAIVVDDQARNCILVVPGANQGLLPQDIQKASHAIQAADVILCQFEVPVEATLEAFRLAKPAGLRTILNPAPARAIPAELLGLTDLCVPNETEMELLYGKRIVTPEEAKAAARTLLHKGPQAWIITLGQRGALLIEKETAEHFPAVTVEAVDSSGAGDAFIGSLAVFWVEGMPLREAVRRANAVAAHSVTRWGTQSAFPTRAELPETHGS